MLTWNICSEYGGANIQCNGIGPGYIATPRTAPLRERQSDGSRHPFDQFIVSKTPAGRWGDPEDLMGPAVFLATSSMWTEEFWPILANSPEKSGPIGSASDGAGVFYLLRGPVRPI